MPADHPLVLTGATGYVGSHLLRELLGRGLPVRAITRHPRAGSLPDEVEQVRADAVSGEGLTEALTGAETLFYLIHSMAGSGKGDFAAMDREAAHNVGAAAREAGVRRVIYLGGLGPTSGPDASEHLRSRHEVARILGAYVPQLVYARAAMVVGEGSASFEIMRHLVQRLPVMVAPRWVDTRSQPIAVSDVAHAMAELAVREEVPGEVHLGGPDVLSYRQMMQRYAELTGHRAPRIVSVPIFTPRLSSHWVRLVTPVDKGLIGPLVEGLRSEMVVTLPPPSGVNDAPLSFDDAVRAVSDA